MPTTSLATCQVLAGALLATSSVWPETSITDKNRVGHVLSLPSLSMRTSSSYNRSGCKKGRSSSGAQCSDTGFKHPRGCSGYRAGPRLKDTSPDLENFVMTKFLAPMPTHAELVFLTPKAAAAKPPFSTTPAGRRGRRADCKWMARTANSGTTPEGNGQLKVTLAQQGLLPDAQRPHASIFLDVLGHDPEFLRHDEKTRGSVG